jgi:hypothetical protein
MWGTRNTQEIGDVGHPAFFWGKERCFNAVYGTTRFVPETKTFSAGSFGDYYFCGSSNTIREPPLPFPVRLCDNLEGFVTQSCRNLEVFLFCSLLF